MKIEHIAVWTNRLEELKNFYIKYFNAVSNEKYISKNTIGFESYFLSFDGDTRLELMQQANIVSKNNDNAEGLTHIAFAAAHKEELDTLFSKMQKDGVRIVSFPRITGDGYYEACVLDPDGNKVEISIKKEI